MATSPAQAAPRHTGTKNPLRKKETKMVRISEQKGNTLHGILLITLFSCAAFYIAQFPFFQKISFSPLIIGILLGMLYANSLRNRLPETWVPGIKFCSKQILRLGIILYGFRLTLQNIVEVGGTAILIDIIIVTVTILLGCLLGKLLKMDKETALLTSVGSAICGAAAVLGADATLKPKAYKTAVAVSTVVIFGTISMFLYPALYRSGILGLDPHAMGVYTGSTLHEVAHVVGAGNAMGGSVEDTAIIVKMIRVMLLVPVLLVLAFWATRQAAGSIRERRKKAAVASRNDIYETGKSDNTDGKAAGIKPEAKFSPTGSAALTEPASPTRTEDPTGKQSGKRKITVPWFAFLFLVVIGFNSLNLLPQACVGFINSFDTFLLTMAMTALGTETSFDKFKKAGPRPFLLAFLLYIWLTGGGFLVAKFLA